MAQVNSQVDVGPLVGPHRLEAFRTYLEKSLESGLLINEMNICGDKDNCVTLTLTSLFPQLLK